jgi:hypothetical protein
MLTYAGHMLTYAEHAAVSSVRGLFCLGREIHDPLKRLTVLLTKLTTLLQTRLFQCGKRAGAELARDP